MKVEHDVQTMFFSPLNGLIKVGNSVVGIVEGSLVTLKPTVPEGDSNKIKAVRASQLEIPFGDPGIVKCVPKSGGPFGSESLTQNLAHLGRCEYGGFTFEEFQIATIFFG